MCVSVHAHVIVGLNKYVLMDYHECNRILQGFFGYHLLLLLLLLLILLLLLKFCKNR